MRTRDYQVRSRLSIRSIQLIGAVNNLNLLVMMNRINQNPVVNSKSCRVMHYKDVTIHTICFIRKVFSTCARKFFQRKPASGLTINTPAECRFKLGSHFIIISITTYASAVYNLYGPLS